MILRAFSVLIALTAVVVGVTLYKVLQVPDLPDVDLDKWWGRSPKPAVEDISVKPFRIDFNDTMVKDLRERLSNRRPVTKTLEGMNSEYGINSEYLEEVLEYWKSKYDFKKRAEMLNIFDHYKTRVQGLDIHFIWQKPEKTEGLKVLPILLLHGWPSSSKEFVRVIPELTKPMKGYDFVFEVVAADLPGYGFSEGSSKPGLNPLQIGIIMHKLMQRLGFNKYYIQAGDWGSQCASQLATMFQDDILGLHINMPVSNQPISFVKILLGAVYPPLIVDPQYSDRIYPLSQLFQLLMRESGYFHIQATKPDTIGAALADTPTGLAAYIIEKMAICSDRDHLHTPHGGLAALELEDVLDTITIVWANNCIVTATRLYAEGMDKQKSPEIGVLQRIPAYVPTAAINFKYEVIYQPDSVIRDKYPNLVHSTTYDFGGHFAALQNPKEFTDDVFEAMGEILKFHDRKSK